MFLLPVLAALLLALIYIVKYNSILRLKPQSKLLLNRAVILLEKLCPCKGSRIYNYYEKQLEYTRMNVMQVFRLKQVLFLITLILVLLIRGTNVSVYTDKIYNSVSYQTDLIYQTQELQDSMEAFNQEMTFFNEAIRNISASSVLRLAKSQIEELIGSLISARDSELYMPKAAMANRIYYRMYDYYDCRRINVVLYLLIAFGVFMIPDLILIIRRVFVKADAKRELRFLKKLIILNGSIKPVDFMELLTGLIDKAVYLKSTLIHIRDMNKKNTVDNRSIYHSIIKASSNLDSKLFYEKLDQANNYDFDQAVLNIENEFKMERRSRSRQVRKQIEMIHVVGIIGFMFLIIILVIYLLMPWMQSYSMDKIL